MRIISLFFPPYMSPVVLCKMFFKILKLMNTKHLNLMSTKGNGGPFLSQKLGNCQLHITLVTSLYFPCQECRKKDWDRLVINIFHCFVNFLLQHIVFPKMVASCCRFLCYFCRISRQNQKAMFEHLSYLLENSSVGLGTLCGCNS